jgi:predicted DNA-binding protein
MTSVAMKGITIKLPESTLKRLEQEARASGRTVSAIIRERVEAETDAGDSVYSLIHDLAGSLSGSGRAATNDRRKFRRS